MLSLVCESISAIGKAKNREDVKSHYYNISIDPRELYIYVVHVHIMTEKHLLRLERQGDFLNKVL